MKVGKDTKLVEYLYTTKDFRRLGLKRSFKIPIPLKVKNTQTPEKSMFVRGYASTTDQDRVDDIITLDALKKSKNDLMQPGSQTVFYNHDRSLAIGKVVKTELDSKGLIVNVKISKADDVKDIRTKIKEGVLNSFSIGGRFKKVQVERDEEGRVTSFKILELELFEVSVVGIPANPKASITDVMEKSFKPLNIRKKKIMAKEKELTDEEKKLAADKAAEEAKNKPLNAVEVQKLIDAAVNPIKKSMEDGMKGIMDAVKAIKPEVKVEEKLEVKNDEMPAWAKTMKDTMDTIQKDLNKAPSRKGVQEEEEEEETEDADVPEKVLKNHKDPKSVAYADYCMNNPAVYEKLSDSEKQTAKSIYFVTMDKNSRKDRA